MNTICIISLLAFVLHTCSGEADGTSGGQAGDTGQEGTSSTAFQYKSGDPRHCLQLARRSNLPLNRFSALPGVGWDNLRNKAAGQVIAYNYTRCMTTEDGRYLIPDAVFTIPVKTSVVQTYAEIFESSNNVTSTTSRSINVDAGLKYSFVQISGSFSNEHTRIKNRLIKDNAAATRIQLRYHRYKANLQPGSQLHPIFKARLLSIARDLEQNLTQSAHYKAQLVVRDYGTHVLSNVIAGAGLTKTDFVSRSYLEENTKDRTVIKASASASFASIFKFGSTYKSSVALEETNKYEHNITHSYINTYGGPILKPYDMTISEWVDGVDRELVPMDRSGDPLSFLITEEAFPNMPAPLREQLEEFVLNAIAQYYEMNTIRGCTQRKSPNFSFAANLDDGSCTKSNMNLTFGGIYQTCDVEGEFRSSNPCVGMEQTNPLTKALSCPPEYETVVLHSGTKLGIRDTVKECRRCGFLGFKKCCHNNYFQARGHYKTHWCAAKGKVSDNTGYLFGGIYSASTTNLVTGNKGCPPMFYPLRILHEHKICLSQDYELGETHAVPFGGFTSCSMGNPLAIPEDEKSGNQLENFLEKPSKWPKQCPYGYSQHLAAVDDGCVVHYCIRTGSLELSGLVPIKRPPFKTRPASIRQSDVYLIYDSSDPTHADRKVVSLQAYNDAFKRTEESDSSVNLGPSATIILTISTVVSLTSFLFQV